LSFIPAIAVIKDKIYRGPSSVKLWRDFNDTVTAGWPASNAESVASAGWQSVAGGQGCALRFKFNLL